MALRVRIQIGSDELVVDGDFCLDDREFQRLLWTWLRVRGLSDTTQVDALANQLNQQTASLEKAVKANTPKP